MTATALGTCVLCGTLDGDAVLEVPYEDVWARLHDDWGIELSAEVRAASAPAHAATLVRCAGCGLERFEPLAPGSADFYAALMASTPYAEDRWDFRAARRLIAADDDVVDLGCGTGKFLASLGRRAARTVGVDHNPDGVGEIVRGGGEAYACSFEEFAAREGGGFDAVTTFHTLEHVGDPVAMVRAAGRCLRPGGRLLLSVPNRERTWREEGEPMDRPPHHVTRWGPAQLTRLAERAGLAVQEVRFEPPGLRQAWSSARGVAGAAAVARAWYAHRSGTDGSSSGGTRGHSMLAIMRPA